MAPAGTSCRSETLAPTGSGSATRSGCACARGSTSRIDRIYLRTTPDGEQSFTELVEVSPGPACRWWEATVRLTMPTTGYRFLIVTPDGHWWLNGSGRHQVAPTDAEDFRLVAGIRSTRLARRPRLLPGLSRSLRRRRSRPTTSSTAPGPIAASPLVIGRGTRRRRPDLAALVEFFGGDLPGLESRLDHLVDLGVNAIYLNPVFESRSNHGYDTIDYGRIAGHFGGDAALVSLRRATRERDIALILDVAPNHTGAEHPWFTDAQADAAAATSSYFIFRERPDDYVSWLGVRSLPKLDYRSAELRDAMYAGPDAVLRRWLRPPFSADGWRIDVANMLGRLGPDQLGPEVARGIRAAVKSENPDAYLMGEHSFDGTDQLAGDEWDGVMNYAGFTWPVIGWLHGNVYESHGVGVFLRTGRTSTADLVQALEAFRAAVPWAIARCQYNLLDSHDTARIRSSVGGDAGRVRAAFGMLLTYVGVPSVLYGDEVGLDGTDGLSTRRTMPWDRDAWDLEQLAFMRTLIRYRVGSRALAVGGFQVLEAGDVSLAFLRDTDDEQVIVVVARGPSARPAEPLPVAAGAVADGTTFVELFSGARATAEAGHLPIGPTPPGVAIWTATGLGSDG